ncbi:MAG: class I SAM-dependent methyltransferase [Bacillota bacterium]|nr:class I SAM-dependent methyltransferase [Bacillota bacterium]
MDDKEIIERARKDFEEDFAKNGYMESRTGDEKHLEQILDSLIVNDGFKVLDLGTGSGYLAFPLAKRNPNSIITGLDIVVNTLARNRERSVVECLHNLNFVDYDGIELPFDDNTFDCIVTRYALHHFPDIKKTFSELRRIIKPNGQLFISDPTPNENDTMRFVDAYMQLKDDGHVQFYTKAEFDDLAIGEGFELENCFMSEVVFRTEKTRDARFPEISKGVDENIIAGYVKFIDGQEWTIEQVLNLSFRAK